MHSFSAIAYVILGLLLCLGLGLAFTRVFKRVTEFSIFEIFGVGASALGILVAIAGFSAQLNLVFGVLVAGLSAVGMYLGRRNLVKQLGLVANAIADCRDEPRALVWIFGFVLFSWLLCQSLNALLPSGHSDALYYHVLGGWWWVRQGRISFLDWSPWILQGGLGEYVYTFAALAVRDAMTYLQVCQVFHFVAGCVASAAVFFTLCRRLGAQVYVSLLFTLILVTFPGDQPQLIHAKNDGFVLFFLTLALNRYLDIVFREGGWDAVGKVAFFCSIVLSVKSTGLFFVIPLAAATVWEIFRAGLWKRPPRLWRAGCLSLFFTVLALSTAIRNFVMTGNPLFPAFQSHFPTPEFMHPLILSEISRYTYVPGSLFEILANQSQYFVFGKPVYALTLFFALPLLRRSQLARRLWLLSAASFTLICLMTGQGLNIRFGFMIFVFMGLLGVMVWVCVNTPMRPLILAGIGVFGLWNSGVEVAYSRLVRITAPLLLGRLSEEDFLSEEMPYYKLHRWANQHLDDNARILSVYQNEALFLNVPLSVPENHRGAAQVMSAETYDDFLRLFRNEGFTHLESSRDGRKEFLRWMQTREFDRDFVLVYQDARYLLYAVRKV